MLKAGGRALTVSIGDGLPKSTSKSAGSRWTSWGRGGARPVGTWLMKTVGVELVSWSREARVSRVKVQKKITRLREMTNERKREGSRP